MARGLDEVWFESRSSTSTVVGKSSKLSEKKSSQTTKSSVRSEGKGVGSRRIFSPIFKLQVLDSYRQDADCQGNQRATARKYGIHRRQIQKWLQMETSLRLSVQQTANCCVQQAAANCCTALNLSSANKQSDDNSAAEPNCPIEASSPIIDSNSTTMVSKVSSSTRYSLCSASSSSTLSSSSSSSSSDSVKENYSSDSEEYINVDEITDTEEDEDDLSSCSSYDKALDFTQATLSKRRFYTADFKLHVLDAFRNDDACKGNQRATARKFGIHRRQVQKWLNRENFIKSEHLSGNLCLDLSQQSKRKIDSTQGYASASTKKKAYFQSEDVLMLESNNGRTSVQESALCLVKEKPEEMVRINAFRQTEIYANTLEHCYRGISVGYPKSVSVDYTPMYCVCTPWNCCYQHIPSSNPATSAFENSSSSVYSKYTYSFDFMKLANQETSYVDIPLQYGFGESVPPKWLKDSPSLSYLHDQPANVQMLTSYR